MKKPNPKNGRMLAWTPFWTIPPFHGNEVDTRGYYFIDDRGVIDGPYETQVDCEHFIKEAKREFPRS